MVNSGSCLVMFSGGLDSATLLYKAKREFKHVEAVFFNYGQRNLEKEWKAALDIWPDFHPIDIELVSEQPLLMGEKKGANLDSVMESNFVPNRNVILLAHAFEAAYAWNIDHVGFGAHAGFTGQYFPDTSPRFCSLYQAMQEVALGGQRIELWAPYIWLTRDAIVQDALAWEVPIDKTWSCYKAGNVPCRECGACLDRERALKKTTFRVVE